MRWTSAIVNLGRAIQQFVVFLKFIIDSGFDIESTDEFGRFPLYSAAQALNASGCKLLLDKGAMGKKKAKDGFTALDIVYEINARSTDGLQKKQETLEILREAIQ